MKKSIFLFFAAILCAMSVSAKMVYLKPSDNWKEAGAIFYVWYWTGSGSGTAGKLNYVGLGGLYGYDIGNHTSFKFTRNKSTSNSPWTDNWGETGDLSYDANKPCYNVVKWNESGSGLTAAPSAYIAGATELTGHNWSANATENKMTLTSGKWTLTKTITSINNGDYEYKVTDGSWGWSLGKDGNNAKINIPATGKYEVTFTYNPSNETVSATATPIYSVTVNAGEGGNATGSGECRNGEYVTIDATPETNYEFVNWTIVNGTGSFESNTTASTKFYATSDATIQANFRSTLTYSLTTSFGEGIASVTGATNPVTLGESYAISATPKTGYAFKTWTANPAENAEFETATNANTNVKVLNGSVDVIASATEILSTLTTANAYSEGDAGLAIPTATVSEIGVVTTADVEATPACVGYVFANWTLTNCERIDGGAANATSITVKSKGDGAAASVVANYTKVPTATVYFVNNKSWSTIKVYAWEGSVGENASWPGLDITANKETEKLGEFDVYAYTVNQGAHAKLIFNDGSGDDSKKTSDYVWADGKYYYMGANKDYAGSTKEEITTLLLPDPLATEVYLAGEMNEWSATANEFKKATADATTASVTVTLEAQTYKFKLVIDGAWKGNTGTMQRGGDAVHEGGWSFDKDGYDDNCQIVADIAGDYTFTWDLTTKKLTVAYPPLPKYTVTATAENGSVTGAGEYEHGSEATLVATPDAGYAFKNWTKGGEVVSTEATYIFTVTANVELVANFVPEETHEVTVSYLCDATPIPGQTTQTLAVGVTTPSTISAPAITNYKFDSWTLGTGVQSEDATTANPIQITTLASGEYTLAANYTKIELTYTVEVPAGTEKCYIRGGFDGWDKFHEMELKDGETNVFTLTIDGAVETDEYKYACQASWDYQEQKEDGGYVENRTWTALDRVEKWAEPAKCYLMGIGGDWTTGIEMEEDGDQFKLLCQPIAEGEQFKFKYGDTWTTDVENYNANGVDWVETSPGSGQYNITLPAGNYDFYYKKAANQVYIAAATDCGPATITLTTGDNSAVIAANIDKTVNVKIERSFTANDGYYTLCVPFNMDPSVIGKAYYLGTITEHVAGEGININLEEETYMLSAGVPYLVLPKANMSELVVENVTIQSDIASGQNVTNGEGTVKIFFEGFYSAPGRTTNGETEYYVGNNGYLYNGEVEIRGLCGIFTITDENGAPLNVRARVVTREDEATGFENITNGENTVIKVIENGQLVIIRNGEKFNAQGQKL